MTLIDWELQFMFIYMTIEVNAIAYAIFGYKIKKKIRKWTNRKKNTA